MRRACTPTSSRSTTPSSFPYDASNVQLGKGGSGVVYLARHHESRQLVALKRCYPRLTEPLLSSASPLAPPTVSDDGFSCASPMMADETSRSLRDLNPAIMAEELDERRTSPMVKPTSAHHRHQSARNEEEMREESNLEVMAANTTNHNNTAAEDDQTACAERNASSSSGGHPSSPLVAADEALLLASLPPHPHIIRFLAKYHSQRRGSYVALELMQSDVGKEMTALRKTNYAQIACIVYSVLQALDHLHAHGIAHRDVKPGNILLKRILPADVGAGSELHALFPENDRTSILMNQAPLVPNMEVPPVELHETVYDDDEEGRCANVGASFSPTSSGKCRRYISATLADFSAAHYVGHVHDRSLASTRGTLYYKAPEQLLGKCIDHYTACDVWGMGCTMFEMAAGHVAFRGRSELQVQLEICRALGTTFADFPKRVNHATLLDELHPGGASEAFGDLLLRMLELDPEKRITARDALAHPFFDPITHARRTVCAGELCANPVQICFTMRLFSARSTEVGLVAMTEPFFPVAITPTKNRQRRLSATADGRRTTATAHNSNEESSPSANPHTSTSSGSPPGPISRRMSASRPPHHVSGGGHPDSGDDECSTGLRSARSGTSPSLTGLPAPCALTSFVSDGPSIHLSQMRCDTADTSLNCSVGITYSPSGRAPHAPLAPHSQPLVQHASSAMMMTHTLRDSSATPSSRLPSAEMLTTGGGYSAARRLSGFSPRTMNSASRILNTSSATTCSSSDGVHAGGSSTHSLCPRPRLTACPLHPPQDTGMEMDGVLHQTATNTHVGTRPRLFMASGSSTTVVRPAYEGGAPACDGPSAAHHHRRSWSGDSSENGMPPPGVAVGRQLGFSEEPSYREGPQGEMMMMMDDDADSIDASALVTPQRRAGMFAAKALSFETPSAERASVAADDSPYNPPHVCSSGRSIPRPTTIMSEMMSGNQRLGHHNTSAMASVEAGGDRCAPPPPPLPVPLTLAAAATRSTPGALVISPRLTISARTPATTIAGVARPYTRSGAEEVHGRRLGGGQGGAGRIIFMERSPNVRPTAENGEQLASPSPKQPYTFAVGACGQRAPHISAPREATEPSPPTTATPRPPMHPNNNAEHAAHHRGGSGMKRARVGDSQHR